MMWELKQRYIGYRVEQYNVIIDVLGGYSKHLEKSVRKLLGIINTTGILLNNFLNRLLKIIISSCLCVGFTEYKNLIIF